MYDPTPEPAKIVQCRGRLAAANGALRNVPRDVPPHLTQAWLEGYDGELRSPTLGKALARYPTQLSHRRQA